MLSMLYFFVGFVSGVYGGQEYDLPKFKPILSLIYFKIKEYFDKLEKVNKQKSQKEINEKFLHKEINEVFTQKYAVTDSEPEEEKIVLKNCKED